jgi:hypothetical protein
MRNPNQFTLNYLIQLFKHRRPLALIGKLPGGDFHQRNAKRPNITSYVVSFVTELWIDPLGSHVRTAA